MAIKGTYNFKGLAVPDALVKIMVMSGGEDGWMVQVGIFAGTSASPFETQQLSLGYRAGSDPLGDMEDKLLSMPEYEGFVRVSPKRLSRLEFLQRFTAEERVAIRTTAKQSVPLEDYMKMLEVANFIDVTRADTIQGVQYLEAVGLIAPGRSAEILAV
jgi:hypothetical protein